MWKHRFRFTALCLLLGAAINFATACGILLLEPTWSEPDIVNGSRSLRRWIARSDALLLDLPEQQDVTRVAFGRSFIELREGPPKASGAFARVELIGWPFRSLRGAGVWSLSSTGHWKWKIFGAIPLDKDDDFGRARLLPMTPVWPGVLGNTIAYTASLVGGLRIAKAFRAAYRQQRNTCGKCGYDLRGALHEACPECGTIVAKRQARQS